MQTFIFRIPKGTGFSHTLEKLVRVDIIKSGQKWYWSYHGKTDIFEVDNSNPNQSFYDVAKLVAFSERFELL